MTKRSDLNEYDELLLADGLETAFIGVGSQYPGSEVAVYDIDKAVQAIANNDGVTHEEALEHFEFNTLCAHVGPLTPIFIRTMTPLED